MTEDTTTNEERAPDSDERAGAAEAENATPAPEATINISWIGTGFKLDFTHGADLTHPSAFFADWFKRNADPLTGIAASEFHVYREKLAQELAHASQELQRQAEGDVPKLVESATPRLVSATGGPLN